MDWVALGAGAQAAVFGSLYHLLFFVNKILLEGLRYVEQFLLLFATCGPIVLRLRPCLF